MSETGYMYGFWGLVLNRVGLKWDACFRKQAVYSHSIFLGVPTVDRRDNTTVLELTCKRIP